MRTDRHTDEDTTLWLKVTSNSLEVIESLSYFFLEHNFQQTSVRIPQLSTDTPMDMIEKKNM